MADEHSSTGTRRADISRWWLAYRARIMPGAVILMALVALPYLAKGFWLLLFGEGPSGGAVDLQIYYRLAPQWFAGVPIYKEFGYAVHPPATYALVWPAVGWLPLTMTRWLWALAMLAALGGLSLLVIRHTGARSLIERAFVVLMLLSMHATTYTIRNGQLTLFLLLVLTSTVLLLYTGRNRWRERLLSGVLLLTTLIKPSVAAPFFWLALFAPGGLFPVLFANAAYVVLTLFAASYQDAPLLTLLEQWQRRSTRLASRGGYGNLHIFMADLGLEAWILPASLAVLFALGLWTWLHRKVDLWLLLGVTALVTRFWTYHREYDDLLILLPMVTLFRIAKNGSSGRWDTLVAAVLLAITIPIHMVPARFHDRLPQPWPLLYILVHSLDWLVVLVFLLRQAYRQRRFMLAAATDGRRMEPGRLMV